MEQDVANRVFEPFFTTKSVGQGTGLGLSVAHGIIAAHNGELKVNTTPGGGATFVITLPALKVTSVDTALPAILPALKSSDSGRVLLVDDDKAVAAVTRALLEWIGFDVTTPGNSIEAMEILRADAIQFDLMFTDHTMPDITGPELAQLARRLNPGIAIVITSGYHLSGTRVNTDFEQLDKPFSAPEVAQAVDRARDRLTTMTEV
jgi:CheY-like chemotaxis protein